MSKQRWINKINELAAARDALDEPMRNLRHAISRAENGYDRYSNPVGLRAELRELDRQWHDLNTDRNNAVGILLKWESAEYEKQYNPAMQITSFQARCVASVINYWSECAGDFVRFEVRQPTYAGLRLDIYKNDTLIVSTNIQIDGSAIDKVWATDLPVEN